MIQNETQTGRPNQPTGPGTASAHPARGWVLILGLILLLAGCESDDCINCVDLPPPVVPTGVHSISGDNEVIIQWYDISYAPYDGQYNENVTGYVVYYRDFEPGDENDPDRRFDYLGEVAWDENFDATTGLHWFFDTGASNGNEYEYAVTAKNAAGLESALSYELVTDAPLPMSPLSTQGWFIPVRVSDFYSSGPDSASSGFDFSRAASNPGSLSAGVVNPRITNDPTALADIQIEFAGGIPYVKAAPGRVKVQDFGVFTDGGGNVIFEGVSWAPADGYSLTGSLELIAGHIYVLEILESPGSARHYAKFGVDTVNAGSVDIIWAYQLIQDLPELRIVADPGTNRDQPDRLEL